MSSLSSAGSATDLAHAFAWNIRVYYEDTDAAGIVFYANYLKFFERARTEWLRQLGIEQQALTQQTGTHFIVLHTSIDYRAPARLDDLLQIVSSIQRLGKASVHFTQQAWVNDKLLATCTIRIGCIESTGFKPVALPAQVLTVLQPLLMPKIAVQPS